MEDTIYDAIISVGTFTGGHLCFTVREQAWEEDDYRAKLRNSENNSLLEQQELRTADYIQQEGARCKVSL